MSSKALSERAFEAQVEDEPVSHGWVRARHHVPRDQRRPGDITPRRPGAAQQQRRPGDAVKTFGSTTTSGRPRR